MAFTLRQVQGVKAITIIFMMALVYKILSSSSALNITTLPHFHLADFSAEDEVIEYFIEHPMLNHALPIDVFGLVVHEVDLILGTLSLLEDYTGLEYKITGEIQTKKRWYNQEELLFLVGRANKLSQQQYQQYRQLLHTVHKTHQFVVEQYNRSQLKLAAGKKVDTLTLLEQILERLKKQ